MNTKVLFLAVIAISLFFINVQTKTSDASDYPETAAGFSNPEVDPDFLTTANQDDGESEEQSDTNNSTASNEDSDDATEDDNDIPENERIHEDGVVADGEYHNFLMNNCEFVEVLLKDKAVKINADSILNTRAIIVTSTQFKECDDISEFDCPKTGFCQVQNLQDEDGDNNGVMLDSEACDVEVLYVYPIPIDSTDKMDLEIKATFNDDLQCDNISTDASVTVSNSDDQTAETSTEATENSSDASDIELAKAVEICSSKDVDTCQTTTDACSSQCMWINCGVETGEGQVTNTSSSCVPLAYTQRNLQQECEAQDEFASASVSQQIISYPDCSAPEQDQSSSDSINLQHPVARMIGLTILSMFTLFVVIVCFYRCQFRKHGEGPFNPPSCCPGFLFPRHKANGFTSMNTHKRQEMMEYEPPVPVL